MGVSRILGTRSSLRKKGTGPLRPPHGEKNEPVPSLRKNGTTSQFEGLALALAVTVALLLLLEPLLELLEQLGVVLAGAVPVAIAIDVGVDIADRLVVGLLLLPLELLVGAQGDVEGLLVVATHDRDLDRLADAVGAHGQDGAVGGRDLRARQCPR